MKNIYFGIHLKRPFLSRERSFGENWKKYEVNNFGTQAFEGQKLIIK